MIEEVVDCNNVKNGLIKTSRSIAENYMNDTGFIYYSIFSIFKCSKEYYLSHQSIPLIDSYFIPKIALTRLGKLFYL